MMRVVPTLTLRVMIAPRRRDAKRFNLQWESTWRYINVTTMRHPQGMVRWLQWVCSQWSASVGKLTSLPLQLARSGSIAQPTFSWTPNASAFINSWNELPVRDTHVLITDSKFSRLHELGDRYFKNIEALRAKAASLNLVLVPACCPVGYSNDLLALNPNLAEALPVRQSLYRVENSTAVHVPDSNVALPKMSDRKKWGFVDEQFTTFEDGLVAAPPYTMNARVMKSVAVQKFQHYHISVWIKTEDFSSQVEIKLLDGRGANLCYTYVKTKPTQDWTEHHVTFNSLDNDKLNLYIGAWGPKSGKLWLRDARMESTGLSTWSADPPRQLKCDGSRVPNPSS